MDQQTAQTPTEPVADAASPPSTEAQESSSSLMDRVIRGVTGLFGSGGPSEADAETGQATEETTEQDGTGEPAWTPPATKAEHDELVRREAQSMKDRELARIAREQQTQRTQADWDRIKAMAEGGDTWAMGEWATEQVRQAAAREQQDAAYGQFLTSHVPLFDQAYLDPMLQGLPQDAWKPIVGDGLTTLEERSAAVPKILAAHRAAAVADSLTKESFVKELLASPSFRAAWAKSPAVREQYMAMLRGDIDEPDAPAGVGVAGRTDMDARLRAGFGIAS